MKLNHLAITCGSEEKADRFYKGLLGLRKIKSATLSNELAKKIFDIEIDCQILLYGNDNMVVEVFVPASGRGGTGQFEHMCLELKDREGFVRKCQVMGLPVRRIPRGDSLLTFIGDYDGNLFEIKELGA